MASPKSKISRSRRGARRAHTALSHGTTINCPNCGSVAQPTKVCPSCGYYKGKEIIVPRD